MEISSFTTYKTYSNPKKCKPSVFTCKLNEIRHFTANKSQNYLDVLSDFNLRAQNIESNFEQRLFGKLKVQNDSDKDYSCFYILNSDSCDQFEVQQHQNMLLQYFEKYKRIPASAETIMNYWVEAVDEILIFYGSVVNFFNYSLTKIEIGFRDREKSIHDVFIQEIKQEDIYDVLWNIHNDIMVFISTNLEFEYPLSEEFDSKIENVRTKIYYILNNKRLLMLKKQKNVEEISNSLHNALQSAIDLLDQTLYKIYISKEKIEKNIKISKDIQILSSKKSDINQSSNISTVEIYNLSNGQVVNSENYMIKNSMKENQNYTDQTTLIANISLTTFAIVAVSFAGLLIGLILVVFIIKLIIRKYRKRKDSIYKQTEQFITNEEMVSI